MESRLVLLQGDGGNRPDAFYGKACCGNSFKNLPGNVCRSILLAAHAKIEAWREVLYESGAADVVSVRRDDEQQFRCRSVVIVAIRQKVFIAVEQRDVGRA